jgi:flagellar hook-associated protein 3 FlgL
MISPLDASTERFLNDLSRTSRRMEEAQRQVTSSKRINRVSDDPDYVSPILETRARVERNEQQRINLGRFKTEVDSAENTMQQAVKVMERARVLATQGATGGATAEMRATLSQEIGVLLEQMVGLANTSSDGRYLFSGDSDQVQPYSIDLSQSDPVSLYAGTPATRQAPHPSGNLFPVARSADQIFDSSTPEQNAFEALNNLRLALAGDDDTGIRGALAQVDTANQYLNQQLAFFGSAQKQVDDAIDTSQRKSTQLRQQLSSMEDADVVQAILELNSASTAHSAALSSRAKMPRTSLFDYLG